ncbi:MAG: TatD family hydrolase [Candidatus Parcubacteria bacterium]|nr:TatD family hydrolase [Candidatus Parcubacteria bacterium]
MLIDSHAHINFKEYDAELDDVIQRSLDNKTWIINVGSNYESSQKAVEIANKFGLGVWAAIGLHPIHLIKDIEEKTEFEGQETSFFTPKEAFNYNKYYELAKSSDKVVGLGETGLDFFRLADDKHSIAKVKEMQINVFKEFIKLAKETDLPLILHCRGEEKDPLAVYDTMLEILELETGDWRSEGNRGVIHCFGGNLGHALKFIDLGFYIGFTGIVTFKNAKDLQQIAKEIPLDKILVETDAPFLAPDPYRGKRNEPTFVRYVAQKIADLKQVTFEEVEKATFENTSNLFKL